MTLYATLLGELEPGGYSQAHGISADGAVVYGTAKLGDYWRAFRWTQETGMVELPGQEAETSYWVLGCSADGSTALGKRSGPWPAEQTAWRWKAGVLTEIGILPTSESQAYAGARASSADGDFIVGYSAVTSVGQRTAFQWTPAGGIVAIAGWGSGDSEGYFACSDDSTIIYGRRGALARRVDGAYTDIGDGVVDYARPVDCTADGSMALVLGHDGLFTWNEAEGFVEVGDAPWVGTFGEYPPCMSSDSSVIAYYSPANEGVRVAGGVTESLPTPPLPEGPSYWSRMFPTSASADGSAIAGFAQVDSQNESGYAVLWTTYPLESAPQLPAPTRSGLRKTARVTYIPAVAGQAYRAASLVCTAVPPPGDTGPLPPPPPPTGGGGGGGVTYYVYVPVNPVNPAMGETRTPFENHPGAGYTCDVAPMQYFIDDPNFPGGLTPVYERRCNWTYP